MKIRSIQLVRSRHMARLFPDSPAPVFWMSDMQLLTEDFKIEPITFGSLLTALVVNIYRLALYRCRWLVWRTGFADIGMGEAWSAARWRLRWWLPRTGAVPNVAPIRWEAWAWAMSPLWFLAPLIYSMHLIGLALGWGGVTSQ